MRLLVLLFDTHKAAQNKILDTCNVTSADERNQKLVSP